MNGELNYCTLCSNVIVNKKLNNVPIVNIVMVLNCVQDELKKAGVRDVSNVFKPEPVTPSKWGRGRKGLPNATK